MRNMLFTGLSVAGLAATTVPAGAAIWDCRIQSSCGTGGGCAPRDNGAAITFEIDGNGRAGSVITAEDVLPMTLVSGDRHRSLFVFRGDRGEAGMVTITSSGRMALSGHESDGRELQARAATGTCERR